MVWDAGSLQTRAFARHALGMAARMEVHADHADQLRFAFPDHQAHALVMDVSEGGMGLQTSVFVPKFAKLEIHVEFPAPESGPAPAPKIFRAIVRRCAMSDVKPTYQIGLQYLDPDLTEVKELLRISEAAKAKAEAQA